MSALKKLLWRLGRVILLAGLVAAATLALVRYAPGYFADSREMDAQHAEGVRSELDARRLSDSSAGVMARAVAAGWLHGNLGVSRQYGVPVWELIRPRLPVTFGLLGRALGFAWLSAAVLAAPLSARRGQRGSVAIAFGSALTLSVPIGALATLFLLANWGGPALAIGLLMAARDFKFLYSLLQREWQAPHLLIARAQGVGTVRLMLGHLLPALGPQLLALVTMSFVVALSLAVPAEVIFDVPGLGQLAWSAAINRDAPVLLAVTLLMAAAVGLAGAFSNPSTRSAALIEAG
jgi:ABC-type dipeptide/oligopeptide/nickel transport system permease component